MRNVRRGDIGNQSRAVHESRSPRSAIPVHGRCRDKSSSIHGKRKCGSRWTGCNGVGNQGLVDEGHRVLRHNNGGGREQEGDDAQNAEIRRVRLQIMSDLLYSEERARFEETLGKGNSKV